MKSIDFKTAFIMNSFPFIVALFQVLYRFRRIINIKTNWLKQ